MTYDAVSIGQIGYFSVSHFNRIIYGCINFQHKVAYMMLVRLNCSENTAEKYPVGIA